MTVRNEEKKAFRDLTPEERGEIVEALLIGGTDCLNTKGEWVPSMCDAVFPELIYRTRPRQLVIPWGVIRPEFKWAAMDENDDVYAFDLRPIDDADQWVPTGDKAIMINGVLNINTTGIDWRDSLTERPEGV